MFEIQFLSGTETRLVARLKNMAPRLHAVLAVKLNKILFMLSAKIVGEKLSGQVLHRRTGILASSVRTIPATMTAAEQIAGFIRAGEGAAFYGKYHEVGVPHSWEIHASKKKALSFLLGPRRVALEHVLHPQLTARSFMRSTLVENAQSVHDQLQSEIDRIVGES